LTTKSKKRLISGQNIKFVTFVLQSTIAVKSSKIMVSIGTNIVVNRVYFF
jgi:prefoldin subunit 5